MDITKNSHVQKMLQFTKTFDPKDGKHSAFSYIGLMVREDDILALNHATFAFFQRTDPGKGTSQFILRHDKGKPEARIPFEGEYCKQYSYENSDFYFPPYYKEAIYLPDPVTAEFSAGEILSFLDEIRLNHIARDRKDKVWSTEIRYHKGSLILSGGPKFTPSSDAKPPKSGPMLNKVFLTSLKHVDVDVSWGIDARYLIQFLKLAKKDERLVITFPRDISSVSPCKYALKNAGHYIFIAPCR